MVNAEGTTWRRPSLVSIDRRISGAPSATGEAAMIVTPVATRVLCRIVALMLFGSGSFEETVEGKLFTATHLLVIDGLTPAQFLPAAPGDVVEYLETSYLVAPNGRGAFVDVQQGDRITDLGGITHLVLGTDVYDEIYPNLQARIVRGEASGW